MKRLFAGALLAAVSVFNTAGATTLSSSLTVDDAFNYYISTNDSVAGTLVGSGTSWGTTYSFNSTLNSNTTYYLHVEASDVYRVIGGFIGSFSLSDNSYKFVNNTQSLNTNTNDWKVSTTGFGSGYTTPISYGVNGVSPWGTRGGIDSSAEWLWEPNQCLSCTVYFSTEIRYADQSVPVPASLALVGAGLVLMRIRQISRRA